MKYFYIPLIVLLSFGFFNIEKSKKANNQYFGVSVFDSTLKETENMFAFTLSVVAEDETCIGGGGKVTATLTETEENAIISFSIYEGNDTTGTPQITENETATGETLEKIFNNRPVGTYTIVVTENVGGVESQEQASFTIAQSISGLDFQLAQERRCDGIAITTNVTQGTVDRFELRNSDGTVLLDTNDTGDFPALTQGETYIVRVFDNCGNVLNRSQQIDLKPFITENFVRSFVRYQPDGTCTDARYLFITNHNFQSNGPMALPIDYTLELISPIDGSTITQTGTTTGGNVDFRGPYFSGESWDFTLTMTNACGITETISNSSNGICAGGPCAGDIRAVTGVCGGGYIWFRSAPTNISSSRTLVLTSYPAAFNPDDYGFVLDTTTGLYGKHYSDSGGKYIGGVDDLLPEGRYEFKVVGDCGNETRVTGVTIQDYPKRVQSFVAYGCEQGEAGVRILVQNDFPQFDYNPEFVIDTAKLTSFPAGYTGETTFKVGEVYRQGNADINYAAVSGLVVGDYTVEVESCGETLTHNFTVEAEKINKVNDYELERLCGSFNVHINDWTSNTAFGRLHLQYFNESTGLWSNPVTGGANQAVYITGNGNNTRDNTLREDVSAVLNNLTREGKYRFITYYKGFSHESTNRALEIDCAEVFGEFEYTYAPLVEDYYVFQCIDGTTTAVIDAIGVEPINYKAIMFNGNPINIDNGTSPVFSGLASGLYTFSMVDDCDNEFQFIANTSANKLPRINADNLCEGETGKLFLVGLDYMDITWTKGADPTVLATGNTLTFDSFDTATDIGEYHANLSYPSDTDACVGTTLSYTITAENTTNPEAGTGQTDTIILQDALAASNYIDLYDYLDGDYDDFGSFTDNSGTLNLLEHKWFIDNTLAEGTYTFDYTVNGGCSGTDSTTITLTIERCQDPILTVGNLTCDATGYTVEFFTNADEVEITAGSGDIDLTTGQITNVPFGTTLTITASSGDSCKTEQTVDIPLTCPTDCIQPELAVGQAVCDSEGGTTYTVSYTKDAVSALSVTGGTDNNDGTISGTIGTDIVVTATNGSCVTEITVASPDNCNDPCENPQVSVGTGVCAADLLSYSVNYVVAGGVTIAVNEGTVDTANNVITDIPIGVDLFITASLAGCTEDQTINVPAPDECREVCQDPVLTVKNLTCEGTTYSIEYVSDAEVITPSAGTLDATNNIITSIPFGTTLTIEAKNGNSCVTESTIEIPASCPTTCIQPDLTVGQGFCDGVRESTYTATYQETTEATITIVGGTDNGDGTLSGTVGTDIVITATNGDCIATVTIVSPDDCSDPCINPNISIGGTTCLEDLLTYDLQIAAADGVTITPSAGTLNAERTAITGIPAGVDVDITTAFSGCTDSKTVTVPAPECEEVCQDPILTVGDLSCDGSVYSVSFITEAAIVIASAGTVDTTNNIITDIPFGTSLVITAQNGDSCSTSTTVTIPNTCPTNCVQPNLNVGQAVCDGLGSTTYTVSYTEITGAVIVVTGGTDNGDGTISGTIGTDIVVTATNGDCATTINVSSPENCDDPCKNPSISIGGTICSDDLLTYSVPFTFVDGVTVTAPVGTVDTANGIITDIPAGTDVVVTTSFAGCAEDRTVTVPAPECEEICQDPILTVGDLNCDGSVYSVSFITEAETVTASAGTVDTTNNIITDIPFGTSLVITAQNGDSCSTSTTVTIPNTCPTNCVQPNLNVGQAVCDGLGSTTYTVSYTEITGAVIVVTGGTDNGDGTISGTIGTDIVVTATNGDCITTISIASPENCDDSCENPSISIGGTICSDDLLTYSVPFTFVDGVTVTASVGTVDTANGIITDIPAGTDVVVTTSFAGCAESRTVTVPAPECEEICQDPILTVGDLNCDGSVYSVSFITEAETVTASAGTVDTTNNIITDIPFGTSLVITAQNGDSCSTSTTVTIPNTCPTNCVQPNLNVGQAVCDGLGSTTYTVSYTEITGAVIVVTGGTDNGDGTISGTIGTDVVVTASFAGCAESRTVTVPAPICLSSAIEILKDGEYIDANGDGVSNVGDEVFYTFTITNTGKTVLTNITVTDPMVAVVGGSLDRMEPGESDSVTFSATYALTQEDIDAKGVYNLATVIGENPRGEDVTGTSKDPTPIDSSNPDNPPIDPTCLDCTITIIPRNPVSPPPPPPSNETDIAISKSVSKSSVVLNEEIEFTVIVLNQGAIDATNIVVSDKLPKGYRFIGATSDVGSDYDELTGLLKINSLAPGQEVTLLMRVSVLNTTDYINIASLESLDQEDINPSNNEAQAATNIVLSGCFEIYNEFTPNNDGKNDYFTIRCIENYPGNTVTIYNRWGIKVYSAHNYQNNWDGTSNGRATINKDSKLPTGTYYYVIDLNTEGEPHVGWLYIN